MNGLPGGLLAMAAIILVGWLMARWLAGETPLIVQIALGGLFGPGLISLGLFALFAAGAESRVAVAMLCFALAAVLAWLASRYRESSLAPPIRKGNLTWAFAIAAVLSLTALVAGFYATSNASPNGDWDAFSIWNVLAKYLAGGQDTWHRAIGSEFNQNLFGAAHPGYPLLLSGFIASQWILGGGVNSLIPIAASLLFSLIPVCLLGGSLMRSRGLGLALLASTILAGSEIFAAQTALQYSDLAVACCFLAGLAVWASAQESGSPGLFAACGFAAGLAPWTKNEGWPFAIAFVALVLWRSGLEKGKWTVAASLPGIIATLGLKFLVKSNEGMFPSTLSAAVSKIADPARWSQTIVSFGQAVWRMGEPWAHPLLLVSAVGLVCGLAPKKARAKRAWLFVPLAAVFAADFAIFLMTTADLQWHLSTSVERLVAQLWPAALFAVFLMIEPLEDTPVVSPRKRASPAR